MTTMPHKTCSININFRTKDLCRDWKVAKTKSQPNKPKLALVCKCWIFSILVFTDLFICRVAVFYSDKIIVSEQTVQNGDVTLAGGLTFQRH